MKRPSEPGTPGLLSALEAVSAWREAQEEEAATQLAEVDAEEARLREAIAELESQIAGLETLRENVRKRSANLDLKELHRSHQALLDSMTADRDLLADRSARLQETTQADRERAKAMLSDAELAEVVKEYEGFAEVQKGLAALPPSYRKAIEDHHNAVKRRLQPILELLDGSARPLDERTEAISLVASVDPVEGPPQALALVLPVDAELYYEWSAESDDLCAHLAYRVVAAVNSLAARIGAPDAPIAFTSLNGLLTIQLWLGDHDIQADLREVATGVLDVTSGAPELEAAKLEVYALWLPPEVLSPPEAEDTDLEQELSLGVESALPEDSVDEVLLSDDRVPGDDDPVPGAED